MDASILLSARNDAESLDDGEAEVNCHESAGNLKQDVQKRL
jgi:hypothetical protein